jgi:hypothetical protein
MMLKAIHRVGVASLFAIAAAAHADCTTQIADPRTMIRLAGPAIVKIQTLSAEARCVTSGTGFVVSQAGHVLTAGHVVPKDCADLSIVGTMPGTEQVLQLRLVERSALDAALLEFTSPRVGLSALSIGRPVENEPSFDLRDVVIVSFYPDLPRPVPTTARIDSTAINGQPNLWALCAVAANPGRSGSPVMTAGGTVLAIFVEKPGGDSQDIARALPIHRILDLPSLSSEPPVLAFKPVDWSGSSVGPRQTTTLDLTFNDEEKASQSPTSGDGRFLAQDGQLTSTKGMNDLSILGRIVGGAQLKFAVRKSRTFNAPEGYVFDPAVFTMRISSHNPPYSKRPDQPCSAQQRSDCHEFSADRRVLTVYYTMYVGPIGDATRGWLKSAITTKLSPTP